ncbi:prion-inhibition and propagation-domain-containing protein [Morchella snyderi]|nr:prion-inhibition and propagation-domain-containing protein [Morchella snyderi]
MEVAGFAFGVLPVATQLFQSSLTLYSFYSETKDVGTTSSKFLILLRIERYRYENWGRHAGLHTGTPTPEFLASAGADLDLVVDILAHIATALLEARKLEKKYGLDLTNATGPLGKPSVSTTGQAQPAIAPACLDSAIAGRQDHHVKIAEEIKSRAKFLPSLRFAVWDKGRFEAIISQLSRLNTGLERVLPMTDRMKLGNRVLLQTLDNESASNLTSLSTATEVAYPGLSEMAMRKATYLDLQDRQLKQRNCDNTTPVQGSSDMRIAYSDINLRKELHPSGRDFGTYQGKEVMVEWKVFSKDMTKDESLSRIQDLARFLSKPNPSDGFNSPDASVSHLLGCLGYIHKPGQTDRAALVFETTYTKHQALIDLIKDPRTEHFNLGARLRLALSLAECIFYLHITGWLHKAIHSGNIIITGNIVDGNTGTKSLRPYLAGFNTARLDRQDEISEKVEVDASLDLYQHPNYQATKKDDGRYTRQYDIYSLGMVLLELGTWEHIQISGRYSARKYNPSRFLERLLDHGPVNSLSFTMGNAYKRVVEWCLCGQFEKKDSQKDFDTLTDMEVLMVFWDNVVIELAKCCIEE